MSPPPRSTGMLPISALTSLAAAPFSSVTMVTTTVHLAVSPSSLNNLKAGVQGQLAPNVNRYFPPLKAIMLGYDQLKLTSRTGALVYDSPQVHIDVQGMFFLFSPEIGGKIPGVVNKKSPGHLGCLVHDTFNVSLLAGEGEKEVKVGSQVMMEVTRVVWGHKSMPIIQGKLVNKEQMEVEEADFDSGIDSTLSQEVKVKKSKKRKRDDEEGESEEKVKKSKKRKKEVEEEELESLQIKEEVVDEEEIKSKKKKKRKKEDSS
eukprot:TRINITY_DN16846_c0_g1_i1.p1 TRINITY_DN16846_c0_g1~~TRINITY_DN16846_c0_g1_i1.p1  ORF type:complete len:275 (-),score=109.52 TRINITY_DN16846_c0_g1_i1:70-852(-)